MRLVSQYLNVHPKGCYGCEHLFMSKLWFCNKFYNQHNCGLMEDYLFSSDQLDIYENAMCGIVNQVASDEVIEMVM